MKLRFWKKAQTKSHKRPPNFIGDDTEAVPIGSRKYNQDGLATSHNTAFAFESRFVNAYSAAVATGSWEGRNVHWRAHTVCWAASTASALEGDFVECGTNRGGTAMLILVYLQELIGKRRLLLFDTFQGLDASVSSEKEIDQTRGNYPDCYQEVLHRFEPYPTVKVIKGTIPDSLAGQIPDRIAFLHIDLNSALPERCAIELLWPKVVKGGVVLLDDYNWTGREDQKLSMDEFARIHNINIMSMPTGQGLIIKTGKIEK